MVGVKGRSGVRKSNAIDVNADTPVVTRNVVLRRVRDVLREADMGLLAISYKGNMFRVIDLGTRDVKRVVNLYEFARDLGVIDKEIVRNG